MELITRAFKKIDQRYRCHLPHRSMERFTNTELADMYLIYGLAQKCTSSRMIVSRKGSLRGHRSSEVLPRGTQTPNMVLGFLRRSKHGTKCVGCRWSTGMHNLSAARTFPSINPKIKCISASLVFLKYSILLCRR
ncbi:hypothetical protein TNCV_3836581 [Trichonephila clavipes]|nr:hypothetical protein TNCV_3836581 [Trichonephila clavipes]